MIINICVIVFVILVIRFVFDFLEEPIKSLKLKFRANKQDKLFHRYCERCRDYNCIDCRKMTTCQSCKYGACYPKREQNYFRERVK